MSKAVLLSIRPEWCEKILGGEKTVEIRKTRPKLEPPFKCYIYCTLAGSDSLFMDVLNRDVAAWKLSHSTASQRLCRMEVRTELCRFERLVWLAHF